MPDLTGELTALSRPSWWGGEHPDPMTPTPLGLADPEGEYVLGAQSEPESGGVLGRGFKL